ncbi:hypothetical protein KI387_015464, partial [Taxus chinensis]
MEETRNKLVQAEPLQGLYALSAAAEFLEWTALNTSESFSYFPSISSFSSARNTSDCGTYSPEEILSKGAYKRHLSDSYFEESSSPDSELSGLTSLIRNKSAFGREKAASLAHLATVACSNRPSRCEFNTLNSPSLKSAKKNRSARSFTHSLRSKMSSVGWISMKTPTTVSSVFNSEDGSPGDGTIDTASTGFASSSSFNTHAQENFFSRQKQPNRLKRREKSFHKANPKKNLGSTRLALRCIAIQKFLLDESSSSETHVREYFGNTPDTSKALRILLKEHRVKRFGAGGKWDPFVYMATVTLGL